MVSSSELQGEYTMAEKFCLEQLKVLYDAEKYTTFIVMKRLLCSHSFINQ